MANRPPRYKPLRLKGGRPLTIPADWKEAKEYLTKLKRSEIDDDRLLRMWQNAQSDASEAPPEFYSDGPGLTISNSNPSSAFSDTLNNLQTGLDAYGVVGDAVLPGSGALADGANALVSVGRAFADPRNAGSHLWNAGVSVVSMIPFLGDLAKLGKAAPRSGSGLAGAATQAARGATRGGGNTAGSPSNVSFVSNIFGAMGGTSGVVGALGAGIGGGFIQSRLFGGRRGPQNPMDQRMQTPARPRALSHGASDG